MKYKKESFKEFRNRVIHKKDSLFANLFLNSIPIWIAYFIKKYNLNITPNQISYLRLFILSSMIIFLLFLAPILNLRIFYLIVAILFYFILLTDWLDGAIARGLNKISEKGTFLDSIADRTAIIVFFTLIISIGLWTQNLFLICGGIFLFVLKTFHLMIISKIFYYKKDIYSDRTKNMMKLFGGEELNKMGMVKFLSFFEKLNNKYLKIKRWDPQIITPERYFLTIMIPALLMAFNLEIFAVFLLYFYICAFSLFFIFRIKNLFKEYV